MPNNSKYENDADYINKIETDTEKFTKSIDPVKKNAMVPPVPSAGEVIRCAICNKEMYPKDFSPRGTREFKYEWKWHIHWKCATKQYDLCDRLTPGLISERGIKY